MVPTDFSELRVLLVGCGSIGRRHARILTELGIRNLLLHDTNRESMHRVHEVSPASRCISSLAAAFDEQPDVAFILTPPHLHIPMSIEALRAGCHVFVEKPLADTLNGIQDLAAALAWSQRKFMVGLCFRYHRGLLKAKRLIEEGTIGRLVSIRALMGEHLPEVRSDYRTLFTSQYSGAFDLTHDIDLAVWFAGQRTRSVKSVFGVFSDIGIQAPDVAEILIEFEDRLVASVHLDFFQKPRRRQFELMGTKGSIVIDFGSWDHCVIRTWQEGTWRTEEQRTNRDDMFRDEDRAFLDAVLTNGVIDCSLTEACKSVRIVLSAQGEIDCGSRI